LLPNPVRRGNPIPTDVHAFRAPFLRRVLNNACTASWYGASTVALCLFHQWSSAVKFVLAVARASPNPSTTSQGRESPNKNSEYLAQRRKGKTFRTWRSLRPRSGHAWCHGANKSRINFTPRPPRLSGAISGFGVRVNAKHNTLNSKLFVMEIWQARCQLRQLHSICRRCCNKRWNFE
jgi:hypothetical protein